MKTTISNIMKSRSGRAMIVLLCSGFMSVGCGHSSANGPAAAPTGGGTLPPGITGDTNGVGTGGNQFSGGATATFVPDSLAVMTSYVAIHPLNAPSNFQINVQLSDTGRGYGGGVQISYQDNGQTYTSNLQSGTGTAENSDGYDGTPDTQYNQWFSWQGKSAFHGFFQDQYGAVILVIDQLQSNGDGSIASTVGGSVYFKNFGPQNCQNPPPLSNSCGQSQLQCWFIEVGPYDCQAFLSNGRLNTSVALYPGNGYTRLGTFSGLSYSSAFGHQ